MLQQQFLRFDFLYNFFYLLPMVTLFSYNFSHYDNPFGCHASATPPMIRLLSKNHYQRSNKTLLKQHYNNVNSLIMIYYYKYETVVKTNITISIVVNRRPCSTPVTVKRPTKRPPLWNGREKLQILTYMSFCLCAKYEYVDSKSHDKR